MMDHRVYELKQHDVAQELVLPWPESSIFLLLYIWKSSKENMEHGEINQQEIKFNQIRDIRRLYEEICIDILGDGSWHGLC